MNSRMCQALTIDTKFQKRGRFERVKKKKLQPTKFEVTCTQENEGRIVAGLLEILNRENEGGFELPPCSKKVEQDVRTGVVPFSDDLQKM